MAKSNFGENSKKPNNFRNRKVFDIFSFHQQRFLETEEETKPYQIPFTQSIARDKKTSQVRVNEKIEESQKEKIPKQSSKLKQSVNLNEVKFFWVD